MKHLTLTIEIASAISNNGLLLLSWKFGKYDLAMSNLVAQWPQDFLHTGFAIEHAEHSLQRCMRHSFLEIQWTMILVGDLFKTFRFCYTSQYTQNE